MAVEDIERARVGGEGALDVVDESPQNRLGEGVVEIEQAGSVGEFEFEDVPADGAGGWARMA